MTFEQPQDGQRLHHIAKRTGLENEDFQIRRPRLWSRSAGVPVLQFIWGKGLNADGAMRVIGQTTGVIQAAQRPYASRSAKRSGRPASRIFF